MHEQGDAYRYVSLEADREQSVPIDPATAYLVLKVAGGTVAGELLKKLVDDIYQYLKSRVQNARIEPPKG